MIIKNKKGRKAWSFFIPVLLAVFIGGFSLASNLGCVSRNEQDTIEKAEVKTTPLEQEQTNDLVDQLSQAFERASSSVSPSVVSIIAEQEVQIRRFGFPDDAFRDFFGEDFFDRFFGIPQPRREEKRTIKSLGSGVIVTEDGYILTNNHVIEKAEKLIVLIGDDNRHEAEIVGSDPPTDVAVIKIDGKNLPSATLGDSAVINVGQWVIAIGNPFQLTHTVTAGIISAKGRSSVGLAEYEDFIQTDASINSGNSGGALADLDGHVIGINTAIASPTGGNIGIGFAIPINMEK
jgi:serine protease Do